MSASESSERIPPPARPYAAPVPEVPTAPTVAPEGAPVTSAPGAPTPASAAPGGSPVPPAAPATPYIAPVSPYAAAAPYTAPQSSPYAQSGDAPQPSPYAQPGPAAAQPGAASHPGAHPQQPYAGAQPGAYPPPNAYGQPSAYPAPAAYPQRPASGMLQWAMGLLVLLPIPFVGGFVAGITMAATFGAAAQHGGRARENARAAANWGLTYLTASTALLIIHFICLGAFAGRPGMGGFYPIGIPLTVYLGVSILHLVVVVIAMVKIGGGGAMRVPFAVPYIRA